VWAENTIGANNIFTTKVDGNVVDVQTRADRHANIWPWDTTLLTDGSHTLTATVTDDTGRTGTATITVTVANGFSGHHQQSGGRFDSSGNRYSQCERLRKFRLAEHVHARDRRSGFAVASVSGTATNFRGTQPPLQMVPYASAHGKGRCRPKWTNKHLRNRQRTPLKAVITAPAGGSTVGGTTTVSMLAVNPTGNQNTFALSVDGVPAPTQTVSTITASYAWDTNALDIWNDSHAIAHHHRPGRAHSDDKVST